MKNLFIFITLLILVHITTELTESQPKPVLDVDGNELVSGDTYHVLGHLKPGQVSGIVPYPLDNCSYGVAQLLFGEGLPLIFRPVNSSKLGVAIYDFTDLVISFSTGIGCGRPREAWSRGEYDKETGQYFVLIGGGKENPGNGTIGNAFQIRTASDDLYKFVFCPETCISCLLECYDVGIFKKDGERRLAETGDTTFHIRFRKYRWNNEDGPKLELARY